MSSKSHTFWNTQPVPQSNEIEEINEAIEPDKSLDKIRVTPFYLPHGYYWDSLNIEKNDSLHELYTLLTENYVEDDDGDFRFDYQPHFLRWCLQPPNWNPEWLVAVRVVATRKLVGFISAIPCTIRIHNKIIRAAEVNFLCVHKKLRSRRLTPVLIKEMTRRLNRCGIFQAVYTGGVLLPRPVTTSQYWHRSLNPKKLIAIGYSSFSRNMTLKRAIKLNKLPDQPITKGLQKMEEVDVPSTFQLLDIFLKQFHLTPIWTESEFKYWFTHRDGIIASYVVKNEETNQITDFISFYIITSKVLSHAEHKSLAIAYLFYCVSTETPAVVLIKDALIVARNMGLDVFTALDIMDNKIFFEPLKFSKGTGTLFYYLYNWKSPLIQPNNLALVLH